MTKKIAFIFFATIINISCLHAGQIPIDCDRSIVPSEITPVSLTAENSLGESIMWESVSFPISVVIDPEMRRERIAEVIKAVQAWNESVAYQIFTHSLGPRTQLPDTIWVTEINIPRNICGDQAFGLAQRWFNPNPDGSPRSLRNGFIRLHTEMPLGIVENTTIHELGHTLGFNHTSEQTAIMYPYVRENIGTILEENIVHIRRMINSPFLF